MSENKVYVMETADMLATCGYALDGTEEEKAKDEQPSPLPPFEVRRAAPPGPLGLSGEQPARQSGGLTEMKPK